MAVLSKGSGSEPDKRQEGQVRPERDDELAGRWEAQESQGIRIFKVCKISFLSVNGCF